MKSRNFKEIPYNRVAIRHPKSRIENGRCIQTRKVAMYSKKAQAIVTHCQDDERGTWSAYKCPFGKRHWHIGHSRSITQ